MRCLIVWLEWDPVKNFRHAEKHGLRFEDAPRVFAGPTLTFVDGRFDYGKVRKVTFGLLCGRMVVVTHTPRGETTRIISMRKGNSREQRAYKIRFEALGRND